VNIPDAIRNPAAVDLGSVYSEKFQTAFRVMYEVRNGSSMDDWYEYADLVVYRALNKLIEGDRVGPKSSSRGWPRCGAAGALRQGFGGA